MDGYLQLLLIEPAPVDCVPAIGKFICEILGQGLELLILKYLRSQIGSTGLVAGVMPSAWDRELSETAAEDAVTLVVLLKVRSFPVELWLYLILQRAKLINNSSKLTPILWQFFQLNLIVQVYRERSCRRICRLLAEARKSYDGTR
ncbi:hypothetical protein CRG98_038592 [Punica granatum]|uniref:Uncharacterized protein n=1 Tax=Punica granatum TaxID=22663 RepID=A0A2I0IAN6_PUNGR|nr:hypothetical protein CRG98_038592 [Punica granatum]